MTTHPPHVAERHTASRFLVAVAVAVGSSVATAWRLGWIWAAPAGFGIDAYYYALQTRALMDGVGHVYFPTHFTLTFHLARLVALLGRVDVLTAMKVVAVLAAGVVPGLVFVIARRVTSSPRAALVGAAVTLLTSLVNYFVVEFVAQLVAIALLLAAVCFYVSCNRQSTRLTAVVVVAGLAAWSHKSALAIVVVAALVFGIRDSLRSLGRPRRVLGDVLLLGISAYVVAGLVEAYDGTPRWPEWRGGSAHLATSEVILSLVAICVIGISGTWSALISPHRRHDGGNSASGPHLPPVSWILLVFCANPLIQYHTQLEGAGERLAMWSWPLSGILTAQALSAPLPRPLALISRSVVCVACLLVCLPRWPPSGREAYVRERAALADAMKQAVCAPMDTVVVAEHGTQFLVTFTTGRRSTWRPRDANSELWWLLRVPLGSRALFGAVPPHEGCWIGPAFLIRDVALERLYASLAHHERVAVLRANPNHLSRGRFGLRLEERADGQTAIVPWE